jgi:hypothetical protein
VEQYLSTRSGKWQNWVRNVLALPHADDTLFIRSYIDQRPSRHPSQMSGHRTTTMLQRFDRFEHDWTLYSGYWDLLLDEEP